MHCLLGIEMPEMKPSVPGAIKEESHAPQKATHVYHAYQGFDCELVKHRPINHGRKDQLGQGLLSGLLKLFDNPCQYTRFIIHGNLKSSYSSSSNSLE